MAYYAKKGLKHACCMYGEESKGGRMHFGYFAHEIATLPLATTIGELKPEFNKTAMN